MDAERAIACLSAATGPLPEGFSHRVRRVGDGILWAGSCVDGLGRPNPGSAWLIGPDGRLWVISSNPGIHNYDLAVQLLEAAYRLGSAEHLDPDIFGDRLKQLTQRRVEDVREFLRDLRAGSLRRREARHLP